METPNLGRLRQVDPRTAWQSEPRNFTPWLAQEENLVLLGESLGIDLELVQQEAGVGAFNADILAKDTASDTFVVIENQLEVTDHIHLGQLLTYASGLDASTIVWISRSVRDEHRAAMDWLNAKTSESTAFFAVEVELWQIGESQMAPKFNVVSRPNTYQKRAKLAQESSTGAAGQLYLEYFTALFDYMKENAPTIRTMSPSPQKWTNISIGKTNYHLRVSAGLQKKNIIVDFVAYLDSDKKIAELLQSKEAEIKSKIPNAVFNRKDGGKESAVEVYRQCDVSNRDDWESQFAWVTAELLAFVEVFRPIVRELP